MADNTILDGPFTTGDVIATDDIAGVKVQRVKVQIGADGAAADVHSGNPLPVTSTQLPAALVGARLDVNIGAGSVSITGTPTVDTELPAAAALADGAANPTTPTVGAALLLYNGATFDRVRGDTTNGVDVDVTRIVAALPAGNNNIGDVDIASSVLPTGAATSANQTTEITALQLIDDIVHAMNAAFSKAAAIGGQLDDTSTTAATEDNIAPVRITAQRAFHTNLRNNAGTEVGTAAAPIRVDPTGTTTQPVSGTVAISGTIATRQVASDATDATNVADSTVRVRSPSELVDNAGFTDGTSRVYPIGCIFDETAGTALTENDVGAPRMDSKRAQVATLEDATTRGQRVAVSAGGAMEVHGEVAHDVAVSGNPVLVGYEGRTTNGTPVTSGRVARALSDTLGKQVMLQGATHEHVRSGRVTLTDTTAQDVIAALGAGISMVVTKIIITNASGATPTKVEIRDGTTVKMQPSAEVFGGLSMPADSPFFVGTANTAITARCVTGNADVDVFISGYLINN